MPFVYGLFTPNAPTLIAPEEFGGITADVAQKLRALDVVGRYRPDVILVATPHWVSRGPFLVQEGDRPRQLYDFSGFPPQLSSVQYEPPGDPGTARELVKSGEERHIAAEATRQWGLDHGAWAPLMHIAPGARVPVVPLSIAERNPEDHLAWGQAIGVAARASSKRVAIVGTGSITHSFRRMDRSPSARWSEGEQIEREIVDLVLQQRYEDVAAFDRSKWERVEPEGDLGPGFILFGALDASFAARVVSTGQIWGAFGTTVIEFAPR